MSEIQDGLQGVATWLEGEVWVTYLGLSCHTNLILIFFDILISKYFLIFLIFLRGFHVYTVAD